MDSFIKLRQGLLAIPLLCCAPSPAWCVTQPSGNNTACLRGSPRVHVSDVSYSVTHTMLPDCQPFVHKHNSFSRALPGSSHTQALLLISTSTYTDSGFSWVDSALCYGFETKSLDAAVPTNAVPESYISFLENSNYLWGSSVATLKNIIWFLLTEQLLAVTQSSIIFPHANSWCCNSLCLSLWSALGCSLVVRCMPFPKSLKHNPDISDLCCFVLKWKLGPLWTSIRHSWY